MYELYIGALTLAYLAAYAAAMRLKTGKAALMGAAIWVFFSFIAGPLLLSSRSGLAGHGLGEAIADFALLLITVLSGVLGFVIQGLRLGPLRRREWARRALGWSGVLLAPLLAVGLVAGFLNALYAN